VKSTTTLVFDGRMIVGLSGTVPHALVLAESDKKRMPGERLKDYENKNLYEIPAEITKILNDIVIEFLEKMKLEWDEPIKESSNE